MKKLWNIYKKYGKFQSLIMGIKVNNVQWFMLIWLKFIFYKITIMRLLNIKLELLIFLLNQSIIILNMLLNFTKYSANIKKKMKRWKIKLIVYKK